MTNIKGYRDLRKDGRMVGLPEWILRTVFLAVIVSLITLPVQAASIGGDGGITIQVSYDNADLTDHLEIDTVITQDNGQGGSACDYTNEARPLNSPSPGSCTPSGGDTCSGRCKLMGDIRALAEYIYTSTHGRHYLKRVYVADRGRAWDAADIKWNMGNGLSVAAQGGWNDTGLQISLNSASRKCIHDVLHHEFGHYFYNLPDRYVSTENRPGYYKGLMPGQDRCDPAAECGETQCYKCFDVSIVEEDGESVMARNFPHQFVGASDAWLKLEYDASDGLGKITCSVGSPPGDPPPVMCGEGGPIRFDSEFGLGNSYASDEWSVLPGNHTDLEGAESEPVPANPGPNVDIQILEPDETVPGTILLLDRSGSMGDLTNGEPAANFAQEAGLYLYHISEPGDNVGTFLYNESVVKRPDYDLYDPAELNETHEFLKPEGQTNIALALKTAIDAMVNKHGEDLVNNGRIILMSDGKQTVGENLWDEVDRAYNHGIHIDTMTFGDADISTMTQIAESTGGTITIMSGPDSASELKLNMARMLTSSRGNTPVYFLKTKLKKPSFKNGPDYFSGKFRVPPATRDMLFYVFLEKSNAAEFKIELTKGNRTILFGANELAAKGRFNGIRVNKADEGEWQFKIKAQKDFWKRMPEDENIEIVAYAENRRLQVRSWTVDNRIHHPGKQLIKAKLSYRYPLTDVIAKARVYDGAKFIETIEMYDDGKQSHDSLAEDGVYTGLIDFKRLNLPKADRSELDRKIRVDVEFLTTEKTRPAPRARYEAGARYGDLVKDYDSIKVSGQLAYSTQMVFVKPPKPVTPRIVPIG
ncbi:MAG: VWA domain-containing protein, partial [Acidobacteriota bacterium]|nr:VWA domain-containing protein [Acidobacteriota bacterium]